MKRERVSAWVDEEDEVIDEKMKDSKVYGKRKTTENHTTSLRNRFQYVIACDLLFSVSRSAYGTQKWAEKKDDDEIAEESDFETFLASTSVSHAITKFRRNDVQMRRRQDLNIDARGSCGAVHSISWQSLGTRSIDADPLLAFVSQKDKEVRVCRVMENGKSSKIEYSLKVNKWITPGVIKFTSPEELVVTNDKRASSRVLIYNVETGQSNFFANMTGKDMSQCKYIERNDRLFSVAFAGGNIATIDKRSKELVSEFRLNNSCVGLGWSNDGSSLIAGDDRANLYVFESRMKRCSTRKQLDTITSMSSMTFNGDSLIACGSPFGTVDVVDLNSWSPVVAFDKLVTGVDRLAFHPIQKTMLIASSQDKKNAMRVYECASGRTMQGWPSETEPIGRAVDIDFSDCGRFFAVGTRSGKVQLYAL